MLLTEIDLYPVCFFLFTIKFHKSNIACSVNEKINL